MERTVVSPPATSAKPRAAIAADLMPRLRGSMTGAIAGSWRRKLGYFSDDAEALEFTGSGHSHSATPRPRWWTAMRST
ncbi:MAG: hypothetical protein ACKVOL_09265 [Novosphingobium sp.]